MQEYDAVVITQEVCMARLILFVVFTALCLTTALYIGCGAATTETGADSGSGGGKDAGGGTGEDTGAVEDAGAGDTGGVASDAGDGCDAHIAVDFPCRKTMECSSANAYYKSRTRPCSETYPAECCSGADCEALGTYLCPAGNVCVPSGDPDVDDSCQPSNTDGGIADGGGDAGQADSGAPDDAGTPDAGAWDGGGGASMGTLTAVNCNVPFVLDATKISNMSYMTSHFSDLIQKYCITGTVGGAVLESYPEKMYFGSHSASPATLSLTQMSMASVTSPQYSVKIDFEPDSNVTTGSAWTVGTEAVAAVINHPTAQTTCLFGWGDSGTLTFGTVSNVTATEGGAFTLSGTIVVVKPDASLCSAMPASLPCCP
jgi:hypothetical protein